MVRGQLVQSARNVQYIPGIDCSSLLPSEQKDAHADATMEDCCTIYSALSLLFECAYDTAVPVRDPISKWIALIKSTTRLRK